MRKCQVCNKEIVLIDYPEQEYYHTEDTEFQSVGLVSKKGKLPSSVCIGHCEDDDILFPDNQEWENN